MYVYYQLAVALLLRKYGVRPAIGVWGCATSGVHIREHLAILQRGSTQEVREESPQWDPVARLKLAVKLRYTCLF